MSRSQPFPLEVTQALLSRVKAHGFDFGEYTAMVAVQHMLEQTVDLFKTAGDMGLRSKNIFALGKIYSNSLPVIKTLRDMGVTVVETTVPEPGEFHSYFERDIDKLWKIVREALAERRIKRLLVLDDGGVCITNVPEDILRQYMICGVEQTSLGMFVFEEKPPRFAVISWARSAVKLEIGGPIFSQCFMEKLNTEFLRGASLEGKQLGVIGLGSIGRGVANLAGRQGNQLLFYDPHSELHVPKMLRDRVTRLDSLEELLTSCDFVLGCSGRNPFQDKWPLNHKAGVKLLSASGGDQEFGPIIRDLRQRSGFTVAPDTWDITSENGPSGTIHIAYLGYPYNFVSRDVEAVPTRIVQLETGGLLAALVQARLYLELCESGQEQNESIHRISPKAQRFVYNKWVSAMKRLGIDIIQLFGYDPSILSAAERNDWFVDNTEPYPGAHYKPVRAVEEKMDYFFCEDCLVKVQAEA
ncbi:MAG TPA: NAD(P)-dependent oxidoreductase [Pyrinomonadaceae bacterium]|nr:NAD(P)-dependent oxidoreductase [Pyrinomonadaceae bacterium]